MCDPPERGRVTGGLPRKGKRWVQPETAQRRKERVASGKYRESVGCVRIAERADKVTCQGLTPDFLNSDLRFSF